MAEAKQYKLGKCTFTPTTEIGMKEFAHIQGTREIYADEEELIAMGATPIQPDEPECEELRQRVRAGLLRAKHDYGKAFEALDDEPECVCPYGDPNCKCQQPHPSKEERDQAVNELVEVIRENNKLVEREEIKKIGDWEAVNGITDLQVAINIITNRDISLKIKVNELIDHVTKLEKAVNIINQQRRERE